MFRNVLTGCALTCILASAMVISRYAFAQNAPPPHTALGATFAVSPSQAPTSSSKLGTTAAVIDGHVIPTSEVVAICLREQGAFVLDQLVQNYVVDRECKRRGIMVSPAAIDAKVETLRADVAPATLGQALAAHHTTLAELRDQFKQDIEREQLVFDQVPPTKMVRCRAIVIKSDPDGAPASVAGTSRTDAQALAEIKQVQSRLAAGADFGVLATKYSDVAADKSGDIGILYNGMHGTDTALLEAGLSLSIGRVTARPVAMNGGYCLLQAVSTSDSHPQAEDDAYAEALATYREQQAQFLESQEIVNLIGRSKVVYYLHN